MLNKNRKYLYFDFTRLLPDDEFLYSMFYDKCAGSGYSSVIINWGSTFPWTFDDRQSLSEQINEKTISSFDLKIDSSKISFVPLFPLFGGMELVLSYKSYRYLRLDNNSSVLNPESPGAKSIFLNLIDDFISLAGKTRTAAFNCTLISRLDNLKLLKMSADLINHALKTNRNFNNIIFFGRKKDKDVIKKLEELVNIKYSETVFADEIFCTNPFVEKSENIENQQEVYSPGISFYFETGEEYLLDDYRKYNKMLWDYIVFLKKEIFIAVHSRIPFTVSSNNDDIYHDGISDVLSKLKDTSKKLNMLLSDRINKNILALLLESDLKIIENELKYIEINNSNLYVDFN